MIATTHHIISVFILFNLPSLQHPIVFVITEFNC